MRSANAGFAKRWILHTLNPPRIQTTQYADPARAHGLFWRTGHQVPDHITTTDGDIAIADDLSGRLFCQTLLPERHTVTVIGGAGYEAFNGETAYKIPDSALPWGIWRIEVEPATPAETDYFLHVLHPTRTSTRRMPRATLLSEGNLTGVFIDSKPLAQAVIFNRDVDALPIAKTAVVHYAVPATTDVRHLVLDLPRNQRYRLSVEPAQGSSRITLTPDQNGDVQTSAAGAASFDVAVSSNGLSARR